MIDVNWLTPIFNKRKETCRIINPSLDLTNTNKIIKQFNSRSFKVNVKSNNHIVSCAMYRYVHSLDVLTDFYSRIVTCSQFLTTTLVQWTLKRGDSICAAALAPNTIANDSPDLRGLFAGHSRTIPEKYETHPEARLIVAGRCQSLVTEMCCFSSCRGCVRDGILITEVI